MASVGMAVIGLIAGSLAGLVVGAIATGSLGTGAHLKVGLGLVVAVVCIGAGYGIFRALAAQGLNVPVKVFYVAAGVGILGGLTVCSGIMFSSPS